MTIKFNPEELITKSGKQYPVVGGRLRIAHGENQSLSITTELIQFESMDQAVVRASVLSGKGAFSAFGASSASKDDRLVDSLLELAETRAIARALRFAGYGVEFTGVEEIGKERLPVPKPDIQQVYPEQEDSHSSAVSPTSEAFEQLTANQHRAILRISQAKDWNPVECCRRILRVPDIKEVGEISKQQAIKVIGKMKEAVA